KNIISPEDAGVDAGPVGDAGPADAGDGGIDGGADGGPDAGPWHAGDVIMVPNSDGWHFSSDGLPSGSVMGASADEDGNIWVAGRGGVFVQRGGAGRFQQFTLADGLHPYGYLPDGSPAESSPSLAVTPAISISGGPGSSAFVGYQGKAGCNGHRGCSGNYEHSHPAINDSHRWFITGGYYGIAIDTWPHVDGQGNTFFDVWFGGRTRTTRFRMGEELGDFWRAQL